MQDDLQGSAQPAVLSTPTTAEPARKRVPKFRNTDNPAETWMGRGKRPNWLKEQLAAGRNLNDFLVYD